MHVLSTYVIETLEKVRENWKIPFDIEDHFQVLVFYRRNTKHFPVLPHFFRLIVWPSLPNVSLPKSAWLKCVKLTDCCVELIFKKIKENNMSPAPIWGAEWDFIIKCFKYSWGIHLYDKLTLRNSQSSINLLIMIFKK